MKQFEKKEKLAFSFSYIDVFFLLLAMLVISFGVYFVAEKRQQERDEVYRVEMSCTLEGPFLAAVPEAGEILYENGEEVGRILSVEKEEKGNASFVRATCYWEGSEVKAGQKKTLETAGCICSMQVEAAEKVDETEEGRLE